MNLARALSRVRVAAMLCGHTHQHAQTAFGGCPVFVCGTSTQYYAPQGNEIQLVEIEVSAVPSTPHQVSVKSLTFDPARGFS